MRQPSAEAYSLRIASLDISQISCSHSRDPERERWRFEMSLSSKQGRTQNISGSASTLEQAAIETITNLCLRPIALISVRKNAVGELTQFIATIQGTKTPNDRQGVGRFVSQSDATDDHAVALLVSILKAASHAGMLKAEYRANNQKVFRQRSAELLNDLQSALKLTELDEHAKLEAQSIILDEMNRVASAAVLTATNHPKPDTILSLFDTSVWLFDSLGHRRSSYTETELWLAWYPGIDNGQLTVDEVIESMPKAPASKIPWIVKLFENPTSWLRFRGAVDLEDHDVMHVLLGRGLQDQDEAFVLGFAMGTAKKISLFQYWVFKLILAKVYPEPYRIPGFLQPAFDLGFQCGKQTGKRNLYRQQLKQFRNLPLEQARREAGIDMGVVKQFYEQEQQAIPFTIASLRLP